MPGRRHCGVGIWGGAFLAALASLPGAAQESAVARAGFRSADYEAQPVLLDPGFEDGALRWTLHQSTTSDDAVAFDGKHSLRIDANAPWGDTGAHQDVELNRTEAKPLLFRATSRADYMTGAPGQAYAVTLQVRYVDGRPDSWVVLHFPPGPPAWITRERVFVPPAPVRSAQVRAQLFVVGRAWFDSVSLSELDAGWAAANFDGAGTLLVASPLSNQERDAAGRIAAKDESIALSLSDSGGCVSRLEIGGSNWAEPSAMALSGFSVRDWATGDVAKVRLPVRAQPSHLRQEGALPALGLQFSGSVAWKRDRLEISAKVDNKRAEERAVTVYFTIPIDAHGWNWWDGLRTSRVIDREEDYAVTRLVGAGGTGSLSVFPAAAITGPVVGLGLWAPADRGAHCRIGYNTVTRELWIGFDAALSPKAGKPPNEASFAFSLAAIPPSQGLRDAVARMHADQPAVFGARKLPEGGIVAFGNPYPVAGWRDFGLAWRTIGWFRTQDEYVDDDKAGVLSLLGIEPLYVSLSRREPPRDAKDLQETVDRGLEQDVSGTSNPGQRSFQEQVRENAHIVQASGVKKAGGEWEGVYVNGQQVWFTTNPDPDLRGIGEHPNKAQAAWRVKELSALYGPNKRGQLDGHWIGQIDGQSDVLDFRPAALQASDGPPLFCTVTRKPAVLLGAAKREFFDFLAAELHKRKKVLIAHNGPEWYWPLCAPFDGFYFDIQPGETDDLGSPLWDSMMLYRMALAGERPVTCALSTNYNRVDKAYARRFLNWCAFYGVWPAWLDHRPQPGVSEPVWATPAWIEPLRAPTRETFELVRELRAAGWRPATWAAIAAPLRVERWGDHKSGTLAFGVYNPTSARQSGTLAIDATALEAPITGVKAKLRAGNQPLPLRTAEGGKLEAALDLEAYELVIVQIRRG